MPAVKVRSGYEKREPYPLNRPTSLVIERICERIVYLKVVGHNDLTGDEWSRMFAEAIDGEDLSSPLGIADVTWHGCAWSVKTVKGNKPLNIGQRLRLICGRNSPAYSANIDNVFENLQATGDAVLGVYNSRINESREAHDDLRMVVLVRNMVTREFAIYERPVVPLITGNYQWRLNANRNFEGIDESDNHVFTWQPHGSQFTIVDRLPVSAVRFRLNREPEPLDKQLVLQTVGFDEDWIDVIEN